MAQTVERSEDTAARITAEHIERARALIGYDEANGERLQVSIANEDSIRAFARSYGDDNPLYCEPDYAARTRWGDVIAPGLLVGTIGAALRGDPRPEAIARAKRSLFKGVHQLQSGSSFEWYRPIRPGDTIFRFGGEESVEVKESKFAETVVLRFSRQVHLNQRGEVVCVNRNGIIHAERSTAAKQGKYKAIEPASYTDEDLAAIDAIYAQEQVRGAEPRYWEDVAIGDALGTMAKGPLTISDIICIHTTGFALKPFGPMTGRLRYQHKLKMPGAYVKDGRGIPDTVMRMHWDDDWARAVGSPIAYDYAFQRQCWAHQFLTDWCGDDGIVLRLGGQARKFNYLGDFQKLTGEIVDKRIENGCGVVDARITISSQRDEVTMEQTATIALPSRKYGPAEYPDPPADISEKAMRFLARHRELAAV